MYNLPHLNELLEATNDQAFVVVPALAVSISQKISDMHNIPHYHHLLEVLEIDGQVVAAVVPTVDVSVGKRILLKVTYLIGLVIQRYQGPTIRRACPFLHRSSVSVKGYK